MRLSEAEFLALMGKDAPPSKKKSKYKNKRVYVYSNGLAVEEKIESLGKPVMVFDSIKEYNRWEELKLLQKGKCISCLRRQVPIVVSEEYVKDGKTVKAVIYKADFTYLRGEEKVVEDVKPFDQKTQKYLTTKDFKLKWKIMQGKYPQCTFELY